MLTSSLRISRSIDNALKLVQVREETSSALLEALQHDPSPDTLGRVFYECIENIKKSQAIKTELTLILEDLKDDPALTVSRKTNIHLIIESQDKNMEVYIKLLKALVSLNIRF